MAITVSKLCGFAASGALARGVRRFAIGGLVFCATAGLADYAQASALQTSIANGSFTYGNTIFTISNCTVTGSSCGNTGNNISVIGVSNGRGGTEIELSPTTGSSIISQSGLNATLSFTLSLTEKPGAHGVSSITDILSGSAQYSADKSDVSATLSAFNGVTGLKNASIKSTLSTPTTTDTFNLMQSTTSPVNFNVSLNYNSSAATGTLTLTNLRLLIQPAPEPASIALFATGMVGLAAVRRRFKQRSQPNNPIS